MGYSGQQVMENFSTSQFLNDLEKTCAAIGAPFSADATRKVLEAYNQNFDEGAVLWRTTNREGDSVNYRFYERHPRDTVAMAVKAGFIKKDNQMASLITSWSSLYDGKPEQSCDFDAVTGLAKTWVFFGGLRPLDDILSISNLPESILRHRNTFHDLDLKFVRHTAVDYHSNTANLYFRAPGPISGAQVARYLKLVNCPPPQESEFHEMRKFLSPTGFTFAVTIRLATGVIERVAFYALKLPQGQFPKLEQRLKIFFSEAPSYDEEEMNAVAWSFGVGGKKYTKAERSYTGRLVPLMRDWNSPMTTK